MIRRILFITFFALLFFFALPFANQTQAQTCGGGIDCCVGNWVVERKCVRYTPMGSCAEWTTTGAHCDDIRSVDCSYQTGGSCNGPCHDGYVGGSCYTIPAPPPVIITPRPQPRYNCSNNQCVFQSGGPYTSSTCNGACNVSQGFSCNGSQCVAGGSLPAGCNGTCKPDDPPPPQTGCYAEQECGDITVKDCCNGQCVPEGTACGGGQCINNQTLFETKVSYIRVVSNENGVLKAWKGPHSVDPLAGVRHVYSDEPFNFVPTPPAPPEPIDGVNIINNEMNMRLTQTKVATFPKHPYFGDGRCSLDDPTSNYHGDLCEPGMTDKEALNKYGYFYNSDNHRFSMVGQPLDQWVDLIDSAGNLVGYNVMMRQLAGSWNGIPCTLTTTHCDRIVSVLIYPHVGEVKTPSGEPMRWDFFSLNFWTSKCGGMTEIDNLRMIPGMPWSESWWSTFPNGSETERHDIGQFTTNARNHPPPGWTTESWVPGTAREGYWSLQATGYTLFYSIQLGIDATLTPPSGYTCKKGYKYDNGSGMVEIEPIIGLDGDCIFRGIQGGLTYIELERATYLNQCFTAFDGKPEVTINTASDFAGLDPVARGNLTAMSNDPNGTSTTKGLSSLVFQKFDPSVTPAASRYARPFSPPAYFVGTGDQFTRIISGGNPVNYWRWNRGVQSQDLATVSLPNTYQSPTFGHGQEFFNHIPMGWTNNRMPQGSYYAFCEMLQATPACSGNPACTYEGGAVNCTGFVSCSDPTNKVLQEFAIRWNQVKHRNLVVNANGKYVVNNWNWSDGPFSLAHLTPTHQVISLAMYDYNDTTRVYMWLEDAAGTRSLRQWGVSHDGVGFTNWDEISNSPGSNVTGYVLPSGVTASQITSHGIRPENIGSASFVEYLFITKSDGKNQGYYRSFPGSSGPTNQTWTASSISQNSDPLSEFGMALVPMTPVVGDDTARFYRGFGRMVSGSPVQYRQQELLFDAENTSSAYSTSGNDFFGGIFGDGLELDAYDVRYMDVGVSDQARLNVRCFSNYNLCSTAGTDSCGVSQPTGMRAVDANPTSINVLSTGLLEGTYQLLFTFSSVPGASEYEYIVYPLDTDRDDATTDAQILAQIRTMYSGPANQRIVGTVPASGAAFESVFLPLNNPVFKNITYRSPKLRIAVRAINPCSTNDIATSTWTIAGPSPGRQVQMTSSIGVRLFEVNENSCSPLNQQAPSQTIDGNIRLTLANSVGGSYAGYPGAAPNLVVNEGNKALGAGGSPIHQLFFPIWYAPGGVFTPEWFTAPGPYSITPNVEDLTRNNYARVCPANSTGLFAPRTLVDIYVRLAFDPWFQARGASVRAGGYAGGADGNVRSRIPRECDDDTTCYEYITTHSNPAVANRSAGIPIGRGSIANTKDGETGGGQLYSQHITSGLSRAENSGSESVVPYRFEDLQLDVQNMISDATRRSDLDSAVSLNGLLSAGSSATVPAYEWPKGSGDIYHVYSLSARTISIDPTARWQIANGQRVVILITGDLTIRAEGVTFLAENQSLANVVPGGFLLLAASGDITIDNSVGRAPSDTLRSDNIDNNSVSGYTNDSLHGIFMAGDELRIRGLDNGPPDTQTDNQFVGRGSFIGLTNVDLDRDFSGRLNPGSPESPSNPDFRYLNNNNPAELFIFDPQLVRLTPEFIKRPLLTYEEIQ